jgi:hypothetical protein
VPTAAQSLQASNARYMAGLRFRYRLLLSSEKPRTYFSSILINMCWISLFLTSLGGTYLPFKNS